MKQRARKIEHQVLHAMAEKLTFHIVYTATAGLMVVYLFLIGSIIVNVIERRYAESQIRELKSEIAMLEIQYLAGQDKINLAYSESLGFVEPKEKGYTNKDVVVVRNYEIVPNAGSEI